MYHLPMQQRQCVEAIVIQKFDVLVYIQNHILASKSVLDIQLPVVDPMSEWQCRKSANVPLFQVFCIDTHYCRRFAVVHKCIAVGIFYANATQDKHSVLEHGTSTACSARVELFLPFWDLNDLVIDVFALGQVHRNVTATAVCAHAGSEG